MRDLRFLSLFPENFKAFTGKHQLKLDLPIGLHRVKGINEDEPDLGSNGAGKSSLWDAILWCCYGRTLRGLRNPDVKPWQKHKGKTRVALLVQVDNERHTIARTVSPNTLTLDGEEAGQGRILKLLGMTFEVMTNTIILGQRRDLFFDMQPRQKLDLLSDAKRLDRWDARSKRASDRVHELEKEHSGYAGEIDGIKYAITQMGLQIDAFEKSARQWDDDMAAKVKEAKAFTVKHASQIERLQKDVDGYDLAYDSAMTEVKAIEASLTKRAELLRASTAALEGLRVKVQENDKTLTGMKAQLASSFTKCPTCGQTVEHRALKKHRDELQRQVRRLIDSTNRLEEDADGLKASIKTAEKVQAREQKHLNEFHAKADDAIRRRDQALPELEELKRKRHHHQEWTKQAETTVNPFGNQLRVAKKRLRRMVEDKNGAVADQKACAKELEETKPWVKGFKEIKLYVIEELLQELELTTMGMLEEVGLFDWEVRYAIESETKSGKAVRGINVFIASPRSKGLVRWEAWSGGEGQRLKLVGALSLASVLLNHAGVDPNIEVVDEPTTSLSDEGVHDLVSYLSQRARATQRTIFYCDHQSIDSTRFASSITVRKDRHGATVTRG